MMQTDTVSWTAAILLSLLVHSAMFLHGGALIGAENAPVSDALLVTRLNFSQPVEVPVPEEPRPVVKPPLKPVAKIKPKPKPKPRPVRKVRKIPRPEPVKKTEPVMQTVSPREVPARQVTSHSDSLLQARRQQYLHGLLSHIESFKFYPRSARRRSIQGNVRISFLLRDDGGYEQLELDGDETVLVKAARQALESAVPLPSPPGDIRLLDRIEFTMAYSLAR